MLQTLKLQAASSWVECFSVRWGHKHVPCRRLLRRSRVCRGPRTRWRWGRSFCHSWKGISKCPPGASSTTKCAHLFRNVACPHAPSNWRSEAKPHIKDRYTRKRSWSGWLVGHVKFGADIRDAWRSSQGIIPGCHGENLCPGKGLGSMWLLVTAWMATRWRWGRSFCHSRHLRILKTYHWSPAIWLSHWRWFDTPKDWLFELSWTHELENSGSPVLKNKHRQVLCFFRGV